MEYKCPRCGTENWLENQSKCSQCETVLRRCIDCQNYDSGKQTCRTLDCAIEQHEAKNPSLLSISTNCASFTPEEVNG